MVWRGDVCLWIATMTSRSAAAWATSQASNSSVVAMGMAPEISTVVPSVAMARDLDRFVAAQRSIYPLALAELRRGHKASHWMWFIFPQLAGLGHSEMARRYGIESLAEARAFLAHPVLGPRLLECAAAVLDATGSAEEILGPIDAVKLRSSMTLFHRAAPDEPTFRAVLERCYGGVADPATDAGLAADGGSLS